MSSFPGIDAEPASNGEEELAEESRPTAEDIAAAPPYEPERQWSCNDHVRDAREGWPSGDVVPKRRRSTSCLTSSEAEAEEEDSEFEEWRNVNQDPQEAVRPTSQSNTRTMPACSTKNLYPLEVRNTDIFTKDNLRWVRPCGPATTRGVVASITVFDDLRKVEAKKPPKPALPRRPVFQPATLVDSSLLQPLELHATLVRAHHKAITRGFVKWSDNMCHFDSVLLLNLTSFGQLGPDYWKSATGERRELSRTETWVLDLLCSYEASSESQMQYLRNVYMWHALEDSRTFGEYVDAMVHAFNAPDDQLDQYHCTRRSYARVFKVACTCAGHPLAKMEGCIRVAASMRHDDESWSSVNLEDCILHSLLADTNLSMRCRSSVPGTTQRCAGEFRNQKVQILIPAFLVVAIDVGFVPKLQLECTIGSAVYHLMGMCLYAASHYICRFRTTASNDEWFIYDDNAKPGRHNPEGKRVIPDIDNNPLANPACFGSRSWFVRGLWFVNITSKGQSVVFDETKEIQNYRFWT